MSKSSSPHESMVESGPYDAHHELLHGNVKECLAQLHRTLGLLNDDVPPALAAARTLPWSGLGANLFEGFLAANDAARNVLSETARQSAAHYSSANAMLEATA